MRVHTRNCAISPILSLFECFTAFKGSNLCILFTAPMDQAFFKFYFIIKFYRLQCGHILNENSHCCYGRHNTFHDMTLSTGKQRRPMLAISSSPHAPAHCFQKGFIKNTHFSFVAPPPPPVLKGHQEHKMPH